MKPQTLIILLMFLVVGAGAYLWFRPETAPAVSTARHLKYQCPMHPQIVRDEPGDCPICHMHLQLVEENSQTAPKAEGALADHSAFDLSDERQQLIGVRTEAAELRQVLRTLRLPGRVAENSSVILAQALEMDGALIKPGLEAEIWVTGEGGRKARVVAVDRALDSFSRTFGVRLELLESAGAGFRPGVYCDVRVKLKLGQGITVSKEAVLDTGDRQLVFVKQGNGHFEPRVVELGKEGDSYIAIRKGVAKGEQVVSSANFLIDSESRFQAAARDFSGGGHD